MRIKGVTRRLINWAKADSTSSIGDYWKRRWPVKTQGTGAELTTEKFLIPSAGTPCSYWILYKKS